MLSNNRAILFLASWYPVSSNPSHGIFIKQHALALSYFQNVIVVYAYGSNEGTFYKTEHRNVNENFTEYFIKYPKGKGFLKPLRSFLNFRKAHKILIDHLIQKKTKVKAIQVNVIFPVSIVLDLYKKVFKEKHTIIEHWSGYLAIDGNYKGSALKHYTKKCIAGASKIWHVSEPQKEAMLKHGLTGNYELIYNAVNTKLFSIKPHLDAKIKLLHVSSLVEKEKNISGTFRVIKKLRDNNHNFNFIVAGGSGNELEVAKKIAQQIKSDNITFTGNLPPEKISELMQQSNALVLFSHYEGMPAVALEAMSCGLPVFASRVGQLPFMTNDGFRVLVNEGNEEELFKALEKLFSNSYNFNTTGMREFVLQHASYEAVGKQMNEYYKTL
jgi:glycosyltransferase involved in cell wall biosynthesis